MNGDQTPGHLVATTAVLVTAVVASSLFLQANLGGSAMQGGVYHDPDQPGGPAALGNIGSTMEPSDAQGQAPGEFDPAPAYPPTAGGTTAGGPSARELWDQGRQVRFGGFPIFRVPRDPTWAEDPFDDTTWLRHYHSLTWLRIPGQAYLETGETRYRVQVKRYLLDWIEANPRGAAPSHRAWFDGAVGYRTDVMVELFRPVLAGALTAHERSLFRESLVAHGGALSTYLRRVGLAGHNHNLFHALQLYNLSVAFPKLPGAGDWRSAARRRVSSLLPEMVSLNEGVSLEQAASYHLLAMELFNKADQFLDRFDDGLSRRERQTLASMAGFAALLLSPTQEMPAIGDTPYGAGGWKRLVALRQAGLTDPFADYVLTHGRSGQRPPDSNFFPESGYAILRPTYSPGEAWSRDLQLVVDMSARARPHGHDDVMNILLTAHGHSLLIDSGGPYAYGKPGRRDFVSALAHNVVVADDASAEPGPLRTLVGMDTAAHAVVAGSYMVAPGVRDHRTVLLAKPDLVLVVDRLRATDREQHRYRLLYHLPPDATVMAAGTAGEVQAGTAGMGFRIVGRRSLRMDVVRGQADPPLGWVTKRHLARKPAAVLKVAQTGRDAWFVSVLAPSSAGDARAPQVRVAERGSALVVTVIRAERTDRFRIGADGTAWLAG